MTRVLVIGARGMLGREVVRAARQLEYGVTRAGRGKQDGWQTFDATQDDPSVLFDEPVDLVVNCAAILASELAAGGQPAVQDAQRVNAVFPHVLAEAAARHGTRLVHISTDAVFAADAG